MRKSLFSIFFIILALIGINNSYSQENIPIGTWRTHLNYSHTNDIALADQKIYCATSNSLFYFDIEDNSINKITTLDGLNEINITDIYYIPSYDWLFIGYGNGNIDLYGTNQIINIPTLKNSTQDEKEINHALEYDDYLYIASDFGISRLNLSIQAIDENYFIGPGGSAVKVLNTQISDESIFALTENELLIGSLDPAVNLQDFNNWSRSALPNEPVLQMIVWQGRILLFSSQSQVFEWIDPVWVPLDINFAGDFVSAYDAGDQLVLCLEDQIAMLNQNFEISVLTDEKIKSPAEAVIGANDILWIADRQNGLVTNLNQGFENFFPAGPGSNSITKLFGGNQVYALPPAVNTNNQKLGNPAEFYQFQDGQWRNYSAKPNENEILLPDIEDLTDVDVDPRNEITYFSSFSDGILQWKEERFEVLDKNIPGSTFDLIADSDILVSSVSVSDDGAVWSVLYDQSPVFHQISPDGTWQHFNFNRDNFQYPVDFATYFNGDHWFISDPDRPNGLLVFNPEEQNSRILSTALGQGSLPSNVIYDLVIDPEGLIWVATEEGVAYFANPFAALNFEEIDAIVPVFEQRPLLSGEKITALAVDNGNRKWIGTENGIWLFGEIGETQFYYFNTENSPLFSNRILDIALLEKTGEVFVATDQGLLSFRSTATEPQSNYGSVNIFPNPVRTGYNGEIGITGLVNNTVLKITTITGKLVKELESYGGAAAWDGRNADGSHVENGIYLLYMSDNQGEQTFIGKIAIVK